LTRLTISLTEFGAKKEMNTPYHSASDLIHKQVDEMLEKYGKWLEEKEEHEKRQRSAR